jgi:hypothetical protein
MTQSWDEFSKSLSEAVPRRQSLRLLGRFGWRCAKSVGIRNGLSGRAGSV